MRKTGFTLIELIMVIVIMGIFATSAGIFSQRIVLDSVQMVDYRGELTDSAQSTLILVSREIRMIRAHEDIHTIGDQSFVFDNADGTRVTYAKSGTDLVRSASGQTNTLCANLANDQVFVYKTCQGEDASLGEEEDVCIIEVHLDLVKGNEEKKLSAVVYPRSFR